VSVALRLATKDDDVGCAIIGTASGLGESSQFVIDIEPTTETPGMKGFNCVEGPGSVTRGVSPRDTHEIFTMINHSVTVGPTTGTGAANSFQLFITDRACGQSCDEQCGRSCSCRKFIDDVESLTLSATDGSGSVTLTKPTPHESFLEYKGTGWGDFFTITMACDPDGHPGQLGLLVLHEPGSECVTRSDTYWINTQKCDPDEAIFYGVDFCPVVVDLVVTE
jgi:hypothetical protein